MQITRVAWTDTDLFSFGRASGYVPHYDIDKPDEEYRLETDSETGEQWHQFTDEFLNHLRQLPTPADELGEAAGRLCYKSYNRPNPATAKTEGYINNILNQQHFSVLEHASVTYYVQGVSRNLLTELERHRHLSFSVVSQRYVDHSESDTIIPPVFETLDISTRDQLVRDLRDVKTMAAQGYEFIFGTLKDHGIPLKQAREAARSVLPGATATEFLVTGNLRCWREILQKRLSPTADAEIRQLSRLILADLKDYAPATFQDFDEEV